LNIPTVALLTAALGLLFYLSCLLGRPTLPLTILVLFELSLCYLILLTLARAFVFLAENIFLRGKDLSASRKSRLTVAALVCLACGTAAGWFSWLGAVSR